MLYVEHYARSLLENEIGMAGNFWESSHHQQWLLDRQDLIRERQQDLVVLTEEEYQKIFIFFSNCVSQSEKKLDFQEDQMSLPGYSC